MTEDWSDFWTNVWQTIRNREYCLTCRNIVDRTEHPPDHERIYSPLEIQWGEGEVVRIP